MAKSIPSVEKGLKPASQYDSKCDGSLKQIYIYIYIYMLNCMVL